VGDCIAFEVRPSPRVAAGGCHAGAVVADGGGLRFALKGRIISAGLAKAGGALLAGNVVGCRWSASEQQKRSSKSGDVVLHGVHAKLCAVSFSRRQVNERQ
jgi:hypothetical protein